MTRMEETEALRARTDVHYNCCQSVLVPFADLCGLDKETAFRLGANFGSGMRHGSTCGAVTGALMVLGLAGKGADEATALMRRFREKNQVLDCANLLRLAKERGEERKCHCDRMVYEAVELLEELLKYARLFEKLLTCKSGLGDKRLDDCLYRMARLEITVTRPFLMEVLRLNQDGYQGKTLSPEDVRDVFELPVPPPCLRCAHQCPE